MHGQNHIKFVPQFLHIALKILKAAPTESTAMNK